MVVKLSCNNRLQCVQCVFFCGTAVGKLRMITMPSGLLVFLRCTEGERPKEKVSSYGSYCHFIENCEVEVGQVAGEQTSDAILRQSPDGVCSAQTARDIKLTIQTLERLSSTLEEISLLLLDSLDLKALTTLVIENLFAEMRQGNEMPVVSQFVHRFFSANKRVSQAPSSRNAASYTTLVGLHAIPNNLVSCRLINYPPFQSLSEMPY